MHAAQYEVHNNVAVITFNNPPVNGLSFALRQAIVQFLEQTNADDAITAIVLTGSERAFSGGADVREFGTPLAFEEPILKTVIARVEDNPKPVVAAIDGVCLGGGFELALGAHYRLASSRARVGLPEVNLGIIPGAGGTQRLPRVIGVDRALPIILNAQMVAAPSLADTDLFVQVVEDDVVKAAIAFAQGLKQADTQAVRVRDLPIAPKQAEALLTQQLQYVKQYERHLPAKAAAVRAILGGVQEGFEKGLTNERAIFLELLESRQSIALRYVFGSERAAARVPEIERSTPVRPVKWVGIYGQSDRAHALQQAFNAAGLGVTTVTRPEQFDGHLNDCDLLIEAVGGDDQAEVETALSALAQVAKQGAILATASDFSLSALSAKLSHPADLLRLQPGPSALAGSLWELGRSTVTDPEVLATVLGLARRAGRHPVVALPDSAAVGPQLLQVYLQLARLLQASGIDLNTIDACLVDFGFSAGPFATARALGVCMAPSLGDEQINDLPSLDAVPELFMVALANHGAKLIDQGLVGRALDIDMLCVLGYGVGRFIGGPLHYCQQLGYEQVAAVLAQAEQRWGQDNPLWQPAQGLAELIKQS